MSADREALAKQAREAVSMTVNDLMASPLGKKATAFTVAERAAYETILVQLLVRSCEDRERIAALEARLPSKSRKPAK